MDKRALSWKSVCDFQCLLKCFPVSHIRKHWLLTQNKSCFQESKNISYQIQKHLMKHYFSVCRRWQDTYRNIGKTNINMTNILRNNVSQFVPGSEAAEAFQKWRGIGQMGHFCIYDQKLNDFMSFTSRTKIFENMESL